MTVDWNRVAELVAVTLRRGPLDRGQRDSLAWIAERLRNSRGAVLADEVGTGKTRIACAVIHAVIAAGGRVATVVPKGLIHQWVAESRALAPTFESTRLFTTLPELFRNADAAPGKWNTLAPTPSAPEWCLLSHNFRTPSLRTSSDTWRVALPALVELELASKADKEDARTREGRLLAWLRLKDKHTVKRWAYWRGMRRISAEVAPRVKAQPVLRKAIRALPDIKISDNYPFLSIDAFRNANGELISEQLLGLWLGDFDLVVIDEAHKSRGGVEEDTDAGVDEVKATTGKVLTRLLGNLLQQTPTTRRICLTATPMELDLAQWLDLLSRAQITLGEEGASVIDTLKHATREAAVAPDEARRIDALCKASNDFTKLLSPHVTRRRRTDDVLVQFIKAAGAGNDGAHPHRNLTPLRVRWTDPAVRANAWIDVLFAAECMSHAARGVSTAHLPTSLKSAYTKLCNGHVSADFDIDPAAPSSVAKVDDETIDDDARDKLERITYWRKHLQEARARLGDDDGLVDSEHPRITLAVREIEAWTEGTDKSARPGGEKVLVFGVFLRPLTVLRDVLNVRHALRAADAGRPLAHSIGKELLPIAYRQLERMRADGQIHGRLVAADTSAVRAALRRARDEYDSLQGRLRRAVDRKVEAWFSDADKLDGIDDEGIKRDVRAHAMAFVLDDFLGDATPGARERIGERVDELAETYFQTHLADELKDTGDTTEEDPRVVALRGLFEQDESTRQRRFAVLLDGDTQAPARRHIQAAFNRMTSSPRVLIAQSQVGREGLNLHEACRVVLQFHAEWNPAILEQQIGRVDRKNSLWEKLVEAWKQDTTKPLPRIEVRQLVFDGTYDAFQWERVGRRQHMFDASLFGQLLPLDAWARVPPDLVPKLQMAAPDFRPPRCGVPKERADTERSVPVMPDVLQTPAAQEIQAREVVSSMQSRNGGTR